MFLSPQVAESLVGKKIVRQYSFSKHFSVSLSLYWSERQISKHTSLSGGAERRQSWQEERSHTKGKTSNWTMPSHASHAENPALPLTLFPALFQQGNVSVGVSGRLHMSMRRQPRWRVQRCWRSSRVFEMCASNEKAFEQAPSSC